MDYDIDDYVVYYEDGDYMVGRIQCILIGKFEICYFIEGIPYFESEIVQLAELEDMQVLH